MPNSSLEEKKLSMFHELWDYLIHPVFDSWTSTVLWLFVLGLIVLAVISIFLWALGTCLEGGAKIIDAYKKSGLPLTFGKEKKAQIRRRQNFCKVINGDLLTLAKAENWNDQYFTDLEAEVEAEGGYYATLLDKMRKRPSQGLRKVSSLISAIELSTETALLIVGQPGSGKSVALRHLGHQFAERGIKSDDPETLIPLYINLKELDTMQEGEINADLIRQFILDNIRRGDSDTAAYVKEHWNDYRERGIWFFLFDSFDEIPAVLHAPTDSIVIRQYAEAIRQFLEGMSSCRGVLASREFKGPNALSWQKMRILPLGEDKQEQLIENSFLESTQKAIVHLHMASNSSSLRNNPLFLTLLCRYVKDHNRPPINDHDLLSGHIDRLARRDEDYVWRKYSLTPDQLIEGAIKIAVLFAENRNLSLAPTQTEIAAELNSDCIPGGSLENMLGALQDVKIGRSDVQEARAGDRRFTFSHRRYQETLFVRHLARTANYLTPRELLTDTRWREYSVTLLQTQDLAIIEPMLIEAASLIEEYATHSVRIPIIQEFGGNFEYFKWKDDPAVSLLSILQEGLERRLNDIPVILSYQIGQLLNPRWTQGDRYDQMMVIKYGGLLPQPLLSEYIGFSIEHGGIEMENIAFQRIVFLHPIPDTVVNWLRNSLSNEAIDTRKQADVLRLEALAARLPDTIGAKYIIGRCQLINRLRRPILFMESVMIKKIRPFINNIANRVIQFPIRNLNSSSYRKITLFDLTMDFVMLYIIFPFALIIPIIDLLIKQITTNTLIDKLKTGRICNSIISSEYLLLYGCLTFICVIVLMWITSLIGFRSVGEKINISYALRRLDKLNWQALRKPILLMPMFIILISGIFIGPGVIVEVAAMLLGHQRLEVIVYPVAFIIALFGIFIYVGLSQYIMIKRLQARLQILKNQNLGASLVLQAQTHEELQYWLKNIELDKVAIRSLLRLLRSPPSYQPSHVLYGATLFKLNWNENSIDGVLNQLMRNLYLISDQMETQALPDFAG